MGDEHRVDCTTTAEILSAELDGEAGERERSAAEAHLESCASCRDHYGDMMTITRAVRVMPVESGPDVTEVVLPAWRPRWRDRVRGPAGDRLRRVLRGLLGVVALVQLWVAFAQVTGFGVDVYPGSAGAPMSHVDHETGAWNAAIAVALGWIAFRARYAAAHLPVLASFGCLLTGLCVWDLVLGQVSIARVVSHLPVLLGLLLVTGLAAVRDERGRPDTPTAGRPESPEQAVETDGSAAVSGSAPAPPAAYRETA
ncbi:zf-HC2 domain-containing protein [Halosaccharopolyspora lacisalsi]|uniref:zf-HC2 domain-containing protein n=1 Tax=Halosaccharopolyspora lacisalsi TaxID=1000566 RepID=UPI0015F9053A|nr:zf-HC2 domain-containing protein [Halosaccharopolyspora lacisalsi]